MNQPSPPAPTADFGSRFSAFVIDGALLFVVQWMIVIVASRQLQAVGLSSTSQCGVDALELPLLCQGPSKLLWGLILVFLLASTVGYHAFFEGRYGATPGKRWMGLHVVKATAMNAPDSATSRRNGIRRVIWALPFLLTFFGGRARLGGRWEPLPVVDLRVDGPVDLATASLRAVIRQIFWLLPFFLFDASPLSLGLPSILVLLLPLAAAMVFARGALYPDTRGLHDLAAGTAVVRSDLLAQTSMPQPAPSHQENAEESV